MHEQLCTREEPITHPATGTAGSGGPPRNTEGFVLLLLEKKAKKVLNPEKKCLKASEQGSLLFPVKRVWGWQFKFVLLHK